jgi:hypothetical protein
MLILEAPPDSWRLVLELWRPVLEPWRLILEPRRHILEPSGSNFRPGKAWRLILTF